MANPKILLIEPTEKTLKNYKRCGLFRDYINRICKSPILDVVRMTDDALLVPDIVARKGRFDYVYPALIPGKGFTKSGAWLSKHRELRVIADASDTDSFQSQIVRLGGACVDVLILRHPCVPNGYSNVVAGMSQRREMFGGTKVVFIPPGIPRSFGSGPNRVRDIDVAMVCTAHPTFKWHQHRRVMADLVRTLPCKTFAGEAWGEKYLDILSCTKIFIVDGSMRGHLVEKYLEGAACGAMLMGEVPTTLRVMLTNNTSISTIPGFGTLACAKIFREKVAYFLGHPSEMQAIADEGRYRLCEAFNQDAMVDLFAMAVHKDFNRRH